ncbi:hypothetical protein [Ferrimonas gelatinilytica]|uniref:Uncharacterized protein n=1 Tax=Ferrimonas gelatinilytica TaxID=1255257 RepID=A0ABP9S6R9_9GAMM
MMPLQCIQLAQEIEQNLESRGSHPIRLRFLAHHPEQHALVVQFAPSQAVCSCVYSEGTGVHP